MIGKNTMITPVKTLVDDAKRTVTSISIDDAIARHDDANDVFIDIRDIRELQREGTIPGSFHAPRGMLEFWADPQSPYHKSVFATDKTIILFCASSWRSALAAKTLQDMGMTNIIEINGGFTAWRKAGGAITDVN
jgi:rhodanese-related sulfurtransferase